MVSLVTENYGNQRISKQIFLTNGQKKARPGDLAGRAFLQYDTSLFYMHYCSGSIVCKGFNDLANSQFSESSV